MKYKEKRIPVAVKHSPIKVVHFGDTDRNPVFSLVDDLEVSFASRSDLISDEIFDVLMRDYAAAHTENRYH